MSTEPRLFREQALEKLSSPDQIDQVMRGLPTGAWLLALAATILLAAAAVWSAVGTIPTNVSGVGMLMQHGGLDEVVALAEGQVVALHVTAGDRVERGQLVARLYQPGEQARIDAQRRRLEELRANATRLRALSEQTLRARSDFVHQQRGLHRRAIRESRDQLDSLRESYAEQQRLAERGLVSRAQLLATQQQIHSVLAEIRSSTAASGTAHVEGAAISASSEREILQGELAVSDAARELEVLQGRADAASRVVTGVSGRVVEVRTRVGDVVGVGRAMLAIRPDTVSSGGLRALVFVPLHAGRQLVPGMRAQVSPANVRREEHGLLVGLVTSISELPSTQLGLQNLLVNDFLVRSIIDRVGAAPIAVEVELVPHPRTPSGYLWTSQSGPALRLGPGTPCDASITVRVQRPLERLLPFVRSLLGS